MIVRLERWHRASIATLIGAAFAAFALGGAPALAQAKGCSHEGKEYKAGDKLVIAGKPMVCDGSSGTWVADKG